MGSVLSWLMQAYNGIEAVGKIMLFGRDNEMFDLFIRLGLGLYRDSISLC